MIPQTGDIWRFHHPYRDEPDSIVLIHEFLTATRNLANKKVLIYRGYDMVSDEYDDFLFTEESIDTCWRKLG